MDASAVSGGPQPTLPRANQAVRAAAQSGTFATLVAGPVGHAENRQLQAMPDEGIAADAGNDRQSTDVIDQPAQASEDLLAAIMPQQELAPAPWVNHPRLPVTPVHPSGVSVPGTFAALPVSLQAGRASTAPMPAPASISVAPTRMLAIGGNAAIATPVGFTETQPLHVRLADDPDGNGVSIALDGDQRAAPTGRLQVDRAHLVSGHFDVAVVRADREPRAGPSDRRAFGAQLSSVLTMVGGTTASFEPVLGEGDVPPATQVASTLDLELPALAARMAERRVSMQPLMPIHSLAIRLQPAGLGTVHANLEWHDDVLSVQLTAEVEKTAELLRSDTASIAAVIRAHGGQPGDIVVNHGSRLDERTAQQHSGQPDQRHANGEPAAHDGRRQSGGRSMADATTGVDNNARTQTSPASQLAGSRSRIVI
jgi:hypothetical protein